MKLEERVSAHFADTAQRITGPPGRVEAVVAGAQGRSLLATLLLGTGVVGAAAAALGLVIGLAGRVPRAEQAQPPPEPIPIIVSPFVTARDQIVTGGDEVVFTVTTDSPAYWRVAALDDYEDGIWKLSAEFVRDLPRLETGGGNPADRQVIQQEFEIRDLDAIWLPSAPEPVEVSMRDGDMFTVDPISRTLAVENDISTSDGMRYGVISSTAVPTAEQLRQAPEPSFGQVGPSYLSTDGFPPEVQAIARQLTDGLDTDYDRIIAIQKRLRSYSRAGGTDPEPDTDIADRITLLLETKRGTADQFATALAMMARELGIPSRVAAGFTTGRLTDRGEESGDGPGLLTYEVRKRDAHVWPEIYFSGAGWVAFEPTPGHEIPGAAGYTEP